MERSAFKPGVGLCSVCRHTVVARSDRGSTFYRCGRAKTEPAYAKYPRLPVDRCAGFEASRDDADSLDR